MAADSVLRLARTAISYHWAAQRSTPANFYAAIVGMVANNLLFMIGVWVMLFAGRPANLGKIPYFYAVTGITAFAWGVIHLLAGGLRSLSEKIESGALEASLATPRRPLLLLVLADFYPTAIGDCVTGVLALGLVWARADFGYFLRSVCALVVSVAGFSAMFILAGGISFFLKRGSGVASLIVEITLGFSAYPMGTLLDDRARWILFLTPAAVTTYLPMQAVVEAGWAAWACATAAALAFLAASVGFFQLGLRRYQAVSSIAFR